jgi:hypothetical protein
MSKTIERRLAAAERRLTPGHDLEIIIIRGGLRGGDPTCCTVGNVSLDRAPSESFAAFKARHPEERSRRKRRITVQSDAISGLI